VSLELNAVYNMDCMEGMKDIPDNYFELAIVDPPYGIGRDKGFEGFGGFGKPIARTRYVGEWDNKPPEKEYFDDLLRVTKNAIIWGGNFFTDKLPVSGHWIFWDKQNTMPTFGDGELAYTSFFKRTSVKRFVYEWNGLLSKRKEERIHATQKPVDLYKWLLANYAKPGDKILDTHVGSGSSIIACIDMGFDYMGFERDDDYYEAMQDRIYHFTRQTVLEGIS